METTEHWIRPGSGKAIALLHGIGATDSQDYWRAFLEVLLSDPALQSYGIFVWKYPTHVGPGKLKNLMSTVAKKTLRETAPRIKQLGAAWDTTYRTQFREYQDVFLICHSMGGLVVKSWIIDLLESGQSERLKTLRHIAFYATPHNGASINTRADWNEQLKDMRLDSPFIEDLGKRWDEHVVSWKDRVPGPEDRLYNRFIPQQVIAGVADGVVPSTSATIRGIPLTTIQGDHSETIQPTSAADTRYKVWRDALDAFVSGSDSHMQLLDETDRSKSLITDVHPYHTCVLSYATADEQFVKKLYADLQAQGVSCWLAEQDGRLGNNLREEIYSAINKHDKLLLVLSQHAIQNQWVKEEIEAALDREHLHPGTSLLFPIRLDETVLTVDNNYLATLLRQRRIGDFRQWQQDAEYQRALQRLLRDLHV